MRFYKIIYKVKSLVYNARTKLGNAILPKSNITKKYVRLVYSVGTNMPKMIESDDQIEWTDVK